MDAEGTIIVGQEFERAVKPPVTDYGPLFQHAALCQLGLPRSRVDGRLFERRSGAAIFAVEGGYWFDGTDRILQPVPYGVMPRLVMFHMCREAVRTRSPVIDVLGSLSEYVQHLGLSKSGQALRRFRSQTIALACCRMELCYVTSRGPGQLKADPIRRFEAFRMSDDGKRGLWPGEIELSGEFFAETLQYAVSLDPEAVHALQGSALALDVYSWMAARLPRIAQTLGVEVTWPALKEQFGQEYRDVGEFRHEFIAAMKKVKRVYPQARVEVVRGTRTKSGCLRLLPSSPAVAGLGVSIKAIAAPAAPQVPDAVEVIATRGETGAMRFEDVDPHVIRSVVKYTQERWTRATLRKLWDRSPFSTAPERDHDLDRKFKKFALNEFRREREADDPAQVVMPGSNSMTAETIAAAQALAPGIDVDLLVEKFLAWNASKRTRLARPNEAFLAWVPKFLNGGIRGR